MGCKTYRPLEVDGELDELGVGDVVPCDGPRHVLAEGALVRRVDLGLVVLQAHPELGVAAAGAAAGGGAVAGAAVARRVPAAAVLEALQPQLEHALAVGGRERDQRCCEQRQQEGLGLVRSHR